MSGDPLDNRNQRKSLINLKKKCSNEPEIAMALFSSLKVSKPEERLIFPEL